MNKTLLIGIGLVVIGGAAWYGISPLFHTLKTDEALPADNAGMLKRDTMASTSTQKSEGAVSDEKSAETTMEKERAGTVSGTIGHPASGTVKIVNANDKNYVRYENLKTINGPDIYVYLSKDLKAKDFVNLGKVKSTEGNSNYEIPSGTKIEDYSYVLIWCKQFGVLFNSALLN